MFVTCFFQFTFSLCLLKNQISFKNKILEALNAFQRFLSFFFFLKQMYIVPLRQFPLFLLCFLPFSLSFLSLFILFFFNIHLFMAVLGLRCCLQAFSSCGERGSPLRCAGSLRWLLLPQNTCASRAVAHTLSGGIFPDEGSNPCPCTGRRIPYHGATREALSLF